MLIYSKKSHDKIVHYSSCRYCASLSSEKKGFFASLDEATANGYRLCSCCTPVAKYMRGNMKRINQYCLEKGISLQLDNESIAISTHHSNWKIIVAGRSKSIFLYHKNTFDRDTDSIIPGYHSQAVRRDTVMEYLEYIAAHEDYRYLYPLKPSLHETKTQPPPRKGTKRWKKEQNKQKRFNRKTQISTVLQLIEQVSAVQSGY